MRRLLTHPDSAPKAKALALKRSAIHVEEVVEHPLLTLLKNVNPYQNLYDLLEQTTLDQEVHGHAYWLIEPGALGVPSADWPLRG